MQDLPFNLHASPLLVLCIIALVVLSIGAGLFRFILSPAAFSYRGRPSLFTPAELCLLETLRTVISRSCVVAGKVRLADIIEPRRGMSRQHFIASLNRVACKHVDFLVCDKNTYQPLYVIELDDSSHNRSDRRRRDRFVDSALAQAGIAVVRIRARASYDAVSIASEIGVVLEQFRRSQSDKGKPSDSRDNIPPTG